MLPPPPPTNVVEGSILDRLTQLEGRAAALKLYERELAYYRADEPYLTVEKCAARCCRLSFLLTAAAYGNTIGDTAATFVVR